jgi:hypothetical protein
MSEAYTAFRETEPCKRCGDGESWTVKGPDDLCIGQSWTGEDAECNAQEEAQALSAAFDLGQASCGNGMPHEAEAIAWKERAEKAEKALEMVNMLACYASEENTDSREAVLLQIGKLARGEVSPAIPTADTEVINECIKRIQNVELTKE